MAAPTLWARCSRCGKRHVSWTLAAEGTTPSGMPSVATTKWYLVPALPRPVGLGPVSSPPRLARTDEQLRCSSIDDHVPGSGLGSGAHQPDQDDMDPAQQGRGAPLVQATGQGGDASAPGCGPPLPPLHAFADEEPQCLDDLDRRSGW